MERGDDKFDDAGDFMVAKPTDVWDEVGKLQEEESMGVNAEAPPESEPTVVTPEEAQNELSIEDFLLMISQDVTVLAQRLNTLEQHHATTIGLMKSLAEYQGLELVQEDTGGGKILIGWKQKKVIMAPNTVNFPGPRIKN